MKEGRHSAGKTPMVEVIARAKVGCVSLYCSVSRDSLFGQWCFWSIQPGTPVTPTPAYRCQRHTVSPWPGQIESGSSSSSVGAWLRSASRPGRTLLKADDGPTGPVWRDSQIAEALELSAGGVAGIRRCFTERGLEGCVRRKVPVREYRTKLDGEQEARRLAERLEIHQMPNHGGWLNRVEVEQSVLVRQALRRRIPAASGMRRRVAT